MRNTLVINMLAGPGAGKTACAWEVASELKKQSFVTEYVSEYAKELVWDGNMALLDGSRKSQLHLLEVQENRLRRLVGKVDFIVTDSPILLNTLYLTEGTAAEKRAYMDAVFQRFSQYNNFCVFVERGRSFEQEGRIHSEQQSRALDRQITELLQHYGIFYGSYTYDRIHYIVPNCIKTFQRLNQADREQHQEDPQVGEPRAPETLEELAAKNTPLSQRTGRMSADEIMNEYYERQGQSASYPPLEDIHL